MTKKHSSKSSTRDRSESPEHKPKKHHKRSKVESDAEEEEEKKEEVELDTEHPTAHMEEEEEAPKKKGKKQRLTITDGKEEEAKKSKVEQMKELLASMTDEEKKEMRIVPAAAAAASAKPPTRDLFGVATAVVATTSAPQKKINVDSLHAATQFIQSVRDDPTVAHSTSCLVSNPDLALFLWCSLNRCNMHFLELLEPEKKLKVTRTFARKFDKATKKWVDIPDQPFLNMGMKTQQRSPVKGVPVFGFCMLSPFAKVAFLKHGPTTETGLGGTYKKVIKQQETLPGNEQYQVSITNNSISILEDENGNNPVVSKFFEAWQNTVDQALIKACEDPTSFPAIRGEIATKVKKGKLDKAPATAAEMAEWMKDNGFFKIRFEEDDGDDTKMMLGLGVSCYRSFGKYEDMSKYKHPPHPMFKLNEFKKKGGLQRHFDLPVFRYRRPDEVEAGKHYDSPFILIPSANAVLTSRDVIAIGFRLGLYEWQFDTAGETNKQMFYIWLNKADALKKMDMANLTPCDFRYACPMAGTYVGPQDPGYVAESFEEEEGPAGPEGGFEVEGELSAEAAAALADAQDAFASDE